MNETHSGMFITFEGIDHCGKTTQIRALAAWLKARSIAFVLVREPGGTAISEKIRDLLLDARHHEMHAVTELLLFSSARAQLVREMIIPSLRNGITVIADRFFDSSTAYQGYGRGIDIAGIEHLNSMAADQLSPDLTFFLDISVNESLRRRAAAGTVADRMENAEREFHERVRQGYHSLAERHAERFMTIRGDRPVDAITHDITTIVEMRFDTAFRED
jgi:dTMP kinase